MKQIGTAVASFRADTAAAEGVAACWRAHDGRKKGDVMSDNLKDRGPRDRARVNVHESWERDYWSKRFGISTEELEEAVKHAGDKVTDVETYLSSHKAAH